MSSAHSLSRGRSPSTVVAQQHIRGANAMTMAEQTPARFSIEDLLKGHCSISGLIRSPSGSATSSKDEDRLVALPVDLSTTGANIDQLPFWLGVQQSVIPLEHSLLLAQRTVLPQLWAAAATSDALRLAATSKSYRRRKARTVFSDQQLQGLEKRFETQRYLSTPERIELANLLNLSETQNEAQESDLSRWRRSGGGSRLTLRQLINNLINSPIVFLIISLLSTEQLLKKNTRKKSNPSLSAFADPVNYEENEPPTCRLDLPVKKLEDLARARKRTAKCLRTSIDYKNGELQALWKICNVYSCTAVDVDNAMRDTRSSLRKKINTTKDPSPFKRLMDDYRPSKQSTRDGPQDIYDTNKPLTKEKPSLLSNIFRRPKETRKVSAMPDGTAEQRQQRHNPNLAEAVKLNYSKEKTNVLPPKPPQIASMAGPPEPNHLPPPIPPTDRIAPQTAEVMNEVEYTPIVRARVVSTKEKVEETKRLSMAVMVPPENEIRKPPVAPPRKERIASTENQNNTLPTTNQPQKRMSPAIPPRLRENTLKKQESLTTVPPTVIQVPNLDGKIPFQTTPQNPPNAVKNATNIQVEDSNQQRIPPSPQTTIRVGGDSVAMSPKVGNDRVQKFQPESTPPRQIQQAQIVHQQAQIVHQQPQTKRQTSIDRF